VRSVHGQSRAGSAPRPGAGSPKGESAGSAYKTGALRRLNARRPGDEDADPSLQATRPVPTDAIPHAPAGMNRAIISRPIPRLMASGRAMGSLTGRGGYPTAGTGYDPERARLARFLIMLGGGAAALPERIRNAPIVNEPCSHRPGEASPFRGG